jgi:hypothetical protein
MSSARFAPHWSHLDPIRSQSPAVASCTRKDVPQVSAIRCVCLSGTCCSLISVTGSLYNLTVGNCSAFQGDLANLLPESSPKVSTALILGGGIYCISSALSVRDSLFLYNVAVNGSGGGLAIGPACSVSCIGCTFSNNSAHLGAGLHLQSQGSLSMSNSTVSYNTATDFSTCSDYGSPSSLCYGKGAGIHANIDLADSGSIDIPNPSFVVQSFDTTITSSVLLANVILSFNAAHKFSLGSSLFMQVSSFDAAVDVSNVRVCRV